MIVVDNLDYCGVNEISQIIKFIKITPHAKRGQKKW